MLTEYQVEDICNQLASDMPTLASNRNSVWPTVYPAYYKGAIDYDATIEIINSKISLWEVQFTFLLLVLAAEGVPYEC